MNKFEEKRQSRLGLKFGSLTIIGWIKKENSTSFSPLCKCDCCGIEKTVNFRELKTGVITGCGKKRGRTVKGNAEIRLYKEYKMRAGRRGINFNLSFNEFSDLVHQNCFYCNFPPTLIKYSWSIYREDDKIVYSGVDRVNSKLGYVINNCVPCCEFCNRAKNERTIEEFLNWLNFVKNGKQESVL